MATFENTVISSRPIAEVVGFLADFENVPRWNYAIVETRKLSQGPVGVGTVYQQVRSVPSRSEERFEVTADDPPRRLALPGQLGPLPSRRSDALDAVPQGTRVTNSVELDELRGPGRLLGRVAVPRVREEVADNLHQAQGPAGAPGHARPRRSELQPGLGSDRRQGGVDGPPRRGRGWG